MKNPTNWRLWGLLAAVMIIAVAVRPSDGGGSSEIERQKAAAKPEAPTPPPKRCDEDKCTDGRAIGWIRKSKDSVLSRLKDPESAKFRNVYFNIGKEGVPLACGEVNSKNSYGGYTGFTHFVSAGKDELTFLEQGTKDFHKLWNRFCANGS